MKDSWDKLHAVGSIVTAITAVFLGLLISGQLESSKVQVARIDTVSKLMPFLVSAEESQRRVTLAVIDRLGDSEATMRLAETLGGPSGLATLWDLASSKDRAVARRARRYLPELVSPSLEVVRANGAAPLTIEVLCKGRGWFNVEVVAASDDGRFLSLRKTFGIRPSPQQRIRVEVGPDVLVSQRLLLWKVEWRAADPSGTSDEEQGLRISIKEKEVELGSVDFPGSTVSDVVVGSARIRG